MLAKKSGEKRMANQEHLDILKQGAETWNKWRLEHATIQPDLSEADLSNADLTDAILIYANLSEADLSNANLIGAHLGRANLKEANLNKADLRVATVDGTVFADVDLSAVKSLDTINHVGHSTIGFDTIYRSHGDIPEAFLKGAGVDDTFITYIRSLVGKANAYYSCFISYSSKD